MIITNIYGGLGNQMFQYALGRKLSILRNEKLKLDIGNFEKYDLRDYLLNNFYIKGKIIEKNKTKKYKIENHYIKYIFKKLKKYNINFRPSVYYEKKEFIYDENIYKSNAIYYEGYWQSFKYFDDIRDVLLQDFRLRKSLNQQNQNILNKIKSSESVSLHIRRGDYVNNPHTNKVHGLCNLEYYKMAVNIINQRVNNPIFFIFSDDLEWVKENLRLFNKSIFVDINDIKTPYYDLELMRYCKHNIIANSTFSWWGAWLNQNINKIVIAPKIWLSSKEINLYDLIPKNWIKI